ncbi:hypothetical protein A2U01_0033951, partial [Trifolium medium]|nr:hypothetical protein [Trifolium medium]
AMSSFGSSAFASMFIDEFNNVNKLTPEVSTRQPESKSDALGTWPPNLKRLKSLSPILADALAVLIMG